MARSAEVAGRVSGNIEISEILTLKPSAVLLAAQAAMLGILGRKWQRLRREVVTSHLFLLASSRGLPREELLCSESQLAPVAWPIAMVQRLPVL